MIFKINGEVRVIKKDTVIPLELGDDFEIIEDVWEPTNMVREEQVVTPISRNEWVVKYVRNVESIPPERTEDVYYIRLSEVYNDKELVGYDLHVYHINGFEKKKKNQYNVT